MGESDDLWRARLSRRDRPGDPRVTPLGANPAMLGYAPTGSAFPSPLVDLHPIRITGNPVAGEPPAKEIDTSTTVQAWVNPTRRPLRAGSEAVAHWVPYQWIVADGVPPAGNVCNTPCGRIYLADTLTLADPIYGPLSLTYGGVPARWRGTRSVSGIWQVFYTSGIFLGTVCAGPTASSDFTDLRFTYDCGTDTLTLIVDACVEGFDHPNRTHLVARSGTLLGSRTQTIGAAGGAESTCDPFRRVFTFAYDPSSDLDNVWVELWGESGSVTLVLTGEFE